ncbi:MAG: hypothetical protein ABW157_01195 [Candidatus Thiodiazotropha sp. LLP2]
MESTETTYNIVFIGKLQQGFEKEQVEKAFSTLFKIPPEKTSQLLRKRRTLKKELRKEAAESLKKKLEGIGLEVSLESQEPIIATEPSLSLIPIEEEASKPVSQNVAEAAANSLTCPSCGTELATMTDPCPNCGVYPHKVLSRQQSRTSRASDSSIPVDVNPVDTSDSVDSLTMKGLIAGAIAALLGALLWKGITVAFDYELGFIAWAIGGGIGFAVAFSGNRGQTTAIFCAIMALVAILGGKYLFYSDLQNQMGEMLADSSQELRLLYEEEMSDARALEAISSKTDMSQYMVDYGYSEASNAYSVTVEELNQFQNGIAPRLLGFADTTPSYEEWYQSTIEDNFDSVSPLDILIESFDFIDAIFLLLGLSTAARIGYGTNKE